MFKFPFIWTNYLSRQNRSHHGEMADDAQRIINDAPAQKQAVLQRFL